MVSRALAKWRLREVLFLILAYVIAGRLALLLAIPPGFATALFPPLGISLAAVLLWGNPLLLGVFFGSTLLNTSIALSNGAPFGVSTVLVASEIAVGSCLAAWFGSVLIKRFVGFPNDLLEEKSIFLFFIIGGPLASCVSATVGVTVLWGNGLVSAHQYLNSWMTWWTGDAIGVLIATPFVFILFSKPRVLWRGRLKTVGVPLLISCALIVSIFIGSSHSEQQKIERKFDVDAKEIAENLFSNLERHIEVLTPLKGHFLASDDVSAESFRIFTTGVLNAESSIGALSWNQKVLHADKEAYEKRIVADGFKNFFIYDYDVNRQQIPAQHRESYVVISYIEPYSKNSRAQGFNVASESVRQQALLLANQTGLPTMTAPLTLVQNKPSELSYLIFMPVYKTLEIPNTVEMRDQLLIGYVTALVGVNRVIDVVHRRFPKADFVLQLDDITNPQSTVRLYQDAEPVTKIAESFRRVNEYKIAGRDFRLTVVPTSKNIEKQLSVESWYVLVGGLLFCSLLGGFLLLVTGRAQYISSLVERRTLELESILDEAVEAIIIVNEVGFIERANPAASRLFKMKAQELMGCDSFTIIPELHDILFKQEQGLSESGGRRVWKSVEAFGICSDGTQVPIEIGVSKVLLPDRSIFTCLIHDITARKKVDKLKSEFVSTVSHELRTPLTSINGALGLLVSDAIPNIPSKAKDLLIIAKSNSERLGRLVNDILDIEKLEFGQLRLELIECDVNDLMRQAIEQNAGYAVKYGVHLALDNHHVASKNIKVLADQDRFLQVMSNLISNAVKFSQMGGFVTVSAKIENSTIIFYIEDTGTGIPEEFRSKIFQKFAQADSSDTRKRDGTGLGLSISRVIVERMGGTIDYTTEIDKGSVFFFSIPIANMD